MKNLTKKDLEGLPYCFTLFIGTSPKNHLKAYEILNFLPNKGIIFTVSRPADNLKDILKTKLEGKEVYFIDSISKTVGYHDHHANTIYLDSPESLTDISIVIKNTLKKLKKKEAFFILDSLSKLTFYHKTTPLFQFMNLIINECRTQNIRVVILGIEEDLPQVLRDSVEDMCDKVLTL